MDFLTKKTDLLTLRSDCLVIFCSIKSLSNAGKTLDKACNGLLSQLKKQGDITGKLGSSLLIPATTDIKADRILVIGTGESNTLSTDQFQKLSTSITKSLLDTPAKNAAIDTTGIEVESRDTQWQAKMVAQHLEAATYSYVATKGKEAQKEAKASQTSVKKVTFLANNNTEAKNYRSGSALGKAVATGMNTTKELGNLPGNVCTPTYLANQAKSLGKKNTKLSVKILDEKQMKQLGMGSLLSVSEGSDEPAKLIVMEYKGTKPSAKPTVLVGKGITFDSGGISLKPGAAMDEMKYDMCGAATVFGTMTTLLELEPSINVVAIVAASENMPSGRATKPGDVVTSMSGQTIEILNTDAEGRLVLCDALTYAGKFKPKAVIDIATLTGACIVALGKHASGLYSNQQELADNLLAAGQQAGDRAWQMPLWDEYNQQLKSNFADMANIGGPAAGSVTAACFLSRFTKEYNWAHLDIAGTAWNSGADKGATGRPVPMLVEYLLNKA